MDLWWCVVTDPNSLFKARTDKNNWVLVNYTNKTSFFPNYKTMNAKKIQEKLVTLDKYTYINKDNPFWIIMTPLKYQYRWFDKSNVKSWGLTLSLAQAPFFLSKPLTLIAISQLSAGPIFPDQSA